MGLEWAGRRLQSNERHTEELRTQRNSEMRPFLECGMVKEAKWDLNLEDSGRGNKWGGDLRLGKAFATEMGILMACVEVVGRNAPRGEPPP